MLEYILLIYRSHCVIFLATESALFNLVTLLQPSQRPPSPYGTQLHDKQGAGFSQSASSVSKLVLFDVPSQGLPEEQYRKEEEDSCHQGQKESYPLNTMTGAVHGSKAGNSESHRELHDILRVGSVS